MGELVETARAHAGADTAFTWIDASFAGAQDLLEDPADPLPMWTPDEPGFDMFDTSRAERAGLTCRPLAGTVRDTLTWDAARGAPWPLQVGLAEERERQLLEIWHASTSA
jgi:2'-hydroxyisoflavone reductase